MYDSPHNFNGLLQFFKVPNNQGTLSWNASQQHPHTNQPKHTFWEEFSTALETSKLLIIPLINHQNQPLYRNYASPNTLHNKFSCTLVGNRDLITSLEQPLLPPSENQNHTTYLLCCSSFCRSTTRCPPSALHLATPLPHSHHVSNSNTHIPNGRKWHKDFNAIKHHHISIQCSSLYPRHWE